MRPTRLVQSAIALVAIGAGLWWVYRPQAVPVETTRLARETFRVLVEADGRTRVRERYIISAPVAGRALRSALRAGDTVVAGEPVATLTANLPPLLDPRARREMEERLGVIEAQAEEAEALRARARVALEKAETDLRRTRDLRERGVAPAAVLERDTFLAEQARRDLVAAERRVHAAEHALAQAREALRRSADPASAEVVILYTPVAGSILRVAQESEATVPIGAPLVEIGDPTDLDVIVDLLTADAVALKPGAPVSIERWGRPGPLTGRVRRIEPAAFTKVSALGVEEQRVWVVIDFADPPAARAGLADAFRVEARILVEEIADALVVPAGALFRRADGWRLFEVVDGRAIMRTVEVARRSGRLAAITGPMAPGAEIVVFPPTTLADGVRVTRVAPR